MQPQLDGRRCIIVVRGHTDGQENQLERQVEGLQRFAAQHGVKVVGNVKIANEQADTATVTAALSALLARKKASNDFNLVLLTDLSRLTRRGCCHGMHLVRLFEVLGVAVATPDTGIIGSSVYKSFRFRLKRGHTRRREKSRKDRQPHEKKDHVESNGAPADPGGVTELQQGDQGAALRNGSKDYPKGAK